MEFKGIIKKSDIYLKLKVENKEHLFRVLSKIFENKSKLNSNLIYGILNDREKELSTGIGESIAIPHAFDERINNFYIIFATLENPIDYNSIDKKPVKFVIAIIANKKYNNIYLHVIANFMEILKDKILRKEIYNSNNLEFVYNLILSK